MALDEGDGQPVVRRALRERGGEHDDADEQGARLEPGRALGLAGGAGLLVVLGGAREEVRQGPPGEPDRDDGGAEEVRGERHPGPRHRGADQGREHRAAAERGVEVRHHRGAEVALDVGALEVHRDVPHPDPEADEEEPGGHGEARAVCVDDQGHREQAGERHGHAQRDGAGRADPVGDAAGERQAGDRPDAGGEQGEPELTGAQAQARLGVGDPRRPRGEDQPGEREGDEDGRAGADDPLAGDRQGARGGGGGGQRVPRRGRAGGATVLRRRDGGGEPPSGRAAGT